MKPEELARTKIDKKLENSGWKICSRKEYDSQSPCAIKEALMEGNTESDYLLFIDNKAIAVIEAKKKSNELGKEVEDQVEKYATHPQPWYGLWVDNLIPLVYMSNGEKILFKNMLKKDSDYEKLSKIPTPKEMLKIIGKTSNYGTLPVLKKDGLRTCQYETITNLEKSLKEGDKKYLSILATGSGKTYLACLASYRLLKYTPTKKILFLVDRNNLARQTESEFSIFDRTEEQQQMSSLYQIKRLRKESDVKANIVISTIQKLFAVLTGQNLSDSNEDREDEEITIEENKNEEEVIVLDKDLKLKPDHFQFIIIDECHRSIYGKWKKVLDYFSEAKVLGLTATPTPEAYAFFNEKVIKEYTYEQSVKDGVNVDFRVYRIKTEITTFGGTIKSGSNIIETTKETDAKNSVKVKRDVDYKSTQLDKSVINKNQIKKVLNAYKEAIYNDLYPNREKDWRYIPKTLIFAKDENHATNIVEVAKEVFADCFKDHQVPNKYIQKITYSADDSNALIRDFRTEKEFRIAVTVTLVSTGTDIRPLEVVFFMKDVMSDVLYTQMKGRGCRTIGDDKLKEVTPNADSKNCYYIVDAVGVTEHDKFILSSNIVDNTKEVLSLEHLIEHLAHNEVSDENLLLLRNYCVKINKKLEDDPLFHHHLDKFSYSFEFSPNDLAKDIDEAFSNGTLEEYFSPSQNNLTRNKLISCLIGNLDARAKLIEMQKGYYATINEDDTLIYSGFSKESSKNFIDNFEKYLYDNKDSIEALRIIYNSEDTLITYTMLKELKNRLLDESKQYSIENIWENYKLLDTEGNVDDSDIKTNVDALTNLIQIVKYAYKKIPKLVSLIKGYSRGFSLYCGRNKRILTKDQVEVMKQVAEYIINSGAINDEELRNFNTDLWRNSIICFNGEATVLKEELQALSKFILKVA